MAPEQAEGKSIDARADVFSFGAVLYEMVTGERAFHGDTPLSTLIAVLREEPKPIGDTTTGPSHELERVITRCLRKSPDRRWQAMADVKVALRELKEESASGDSTAAAAAVHSSRGRRLRLSPQRRFSSLLRRARRVARFWLKRDPPPAPSSRPGSAVPLTTYHGREQQPALSPDGNSVAFTWNGEAEDNWDIWVKLIGPGSPLRLTSDPAMDLGPAWSPDGRSIAFVRVRGDRLVVIVVPALGGPEREVADTPQGTGYGQNVSWSPDSRMLVLAASTPTTRESLIAVDVATGETRPILTPPARMAHTMPAISPDGKALAFVRRSGALTGELYVQRISDGFTPVGDPRPLDGQAHMYYGVTWSPDGSAVIASRGNTGDIGVWRIPLQHPDRPERISPPGEDWRQPSVSLRQGRLAAARATWDENMWRVDLRGPGQPAGTPVSLVGSTRSELNAQFSPDGRRIAFESFRSGTQEVYVADADGRNAQQLTTFNGARGGTPAWSPAGQSIAFDMRGSDGKGDIFVAPVRGGAAVRITTDPADDLVPAWSHDGRWIYFESTRTGRAEMWKMPACGGDPVQITHGGATYAKESVDGRYLYYSRFLSGVRSLRRISTSGGEDVEIRQQIAHYANFAVVKDGVYYEAPPPAGELGLRSLFAPFGRGATIEFLSFAPGGKITTVLKLTQYAGHGLDVSPDGRTLLFGQMDGFSEDLLLIENVR